MKANAEPAPSINRLVSSQVRPVLIVGNGMLGEAFARVCERRGLPYRVLSRDQMDITRAEMVDAALGEYNPWVVVNAAGFTGVDDAEVDENRCYAVNARGVSVLANACARETVKLVTFSSDLVFDGSGSEPLTERSRVHPRTVFGDSKVKGERVVRQTLPSALIVRTGPLFGPWDERNDLTRALRVLVERGQVRLAHDEIVSPTYVPDLVNATLDLLIDSESGIWHLVNQGAVSPAVLVRQAASVAGITGATVRGVPSRSFGHLAPREGYRVLGSERANLMPSLEDALGRYVAERRLLAHNLPLSLSERDLSITGERNDRTAVYQDV
jgi:dTDP-4-dehydrorhamnose reductase